MTETRVFVVRSVVWDANPIHGVFSTQEMAEAHVRKAQEENRYTEYEIIAYPLDCASDDGTQEWAYPALGE